jgi:hypothetical protein
MFSVVIAGVVKFVSGKHSFDLCGLSEIHSLSVEILVVVNHIFAIFFQIPF